MPSSIFAFEALKDLWLAGVEGALAKVASELAPDDELYAVAFWLFYAETGSVIYPPVVGIGCEKSAQMLFGHESRYAGFGSGRWNPADWQYSIVTLPNENEIKSSYHELAKYACGGVDPEKTRHSLPSNAASDLWQVAFDQSIEALIATCRELVSRARAKAGVFADLRLNHEFVAVVCDPSQGEEGEKWLCRCVDEPLRSTLFPNVSA